MFASLFNVEFTKVYLILRFPFVLESVLAQCLDLACLDLLYSMCLQNFAYFLLSIQDLLVKCFLFLLTHGPIFVERVFYVDKIGVAILEEVYVSVQRDSADFSMQSLHTNDTLVLANLTM